MRTVKCPHCGGEVHVQAAAKAPAAVPAELEGLRLYAEDQKLVSRWAELREAWDQAYPYLDVLGEIRKAHAWEVANPSLRKVNRARFLGNWLARAQDSNRRRPGQVPMEPAKAAEEYKPKQKWFEEGMAAFLAREGF